MPSHSPDENVAQRVIQVRSLPACLSLTVSLYFFRVGGEKVLLLSAAAWGSMTAFTPILAHLCSQPIVSMTLARFLMGLLQGEELAEGVLESSLQITSVRQKDAHYELTDISYKTSFY